MKKIIKTKKAPAPIGPYNQAILSNGILFTSGQIAIHPESNELITNNISAETQQVMSNLGAVLKASEMDFENVVKTTIYITNMNDFSKINSIYAAFFDEDNAPARETVQVSKLPKNVHVEISAIAVR